MDTILIKYGDPYINNLLNKIKVKEYELQYLKSSYTDFVSSELGIALQKLYAIYPPSKKTDPAVKDDTFGKTNGNLMKKLYKLIVPKVHSDKTHAPNDEEFVLITKYVETNNIIKLLEMADKHNIDYHHLMTKNMFITHIIKYLNGLKSTIQIFKNSDFYQLVTDQITLADFEETLKLHRQLEKENEELKEGH